MNTNLRPETQTVRYSVSTEPPKSRKTHRVAQNFRNFFGSDASQPVSAVSLSRLIGMLDCEHAEGSMYAVVSKRTKAGHCATTVLDVPLRKLYRAEHPLSISGLWKGVAARSGGTVQYLQTHEEFTPLPEPEKVVPERWYVAARGADQ